MVKKKPVKDVNVTAYEILQTLTDEPAKKSAKATDQPEKNPAAVALGRLGGLKGGKARADKLTPKKRQAIAQKAAEARWTGRKGR